MRDRVRQHLRDRQHAFTAVQAHLRLLGPEQVLARGYSITSDAATGKVIQDAAKVKAGQCLKTRLKIGEIYSKTEK